MSVSLKIFSIVPRLFVIVLQCNFIYRKNLQFKYVCLVVTVYRVTFLPPSQIPFTLSRHQGDFRESFHSTVGLVSDLSEDICLLIFNRFSIAGGVPWQAQRL